MKTFKLFSKCSGVKPNILNFEAAGRGSLKKCKHCILCY